MWLTIKQAAERLGAGESTVHLWVTKGYFPGARKFGRDWLIPEDDLTDFKPPPRGRPFGSKKKPRH